MTLSEKKLYHQIHPLKLFVDISTSIITLYLFWYHYFLIALTLHFLLPILGTFFVIRYTNLEKQKHSAFGKYIKKRMNGWVEGTRLLGDIITIFGAWYHLWILLAFGLTIILLAWFNGKLKFYRSIK